MMSHESLKPSPLAAPLAKRITILGATGSIGNSTIDIISKSPELFSVEALTAANNVKKLVELAKLLRPRVVVIENEEHLPALRHALADTGIEVAGGKNAIIEAAAREVDLLISGIMGAAALPPTLKAIEKGTTVALANKECLVCAGALITETARKYGSTLLPVDSEHNAIFQSFDFEHPENIEKITLTASGGPFRTMPADELKNVTVKQAITHPNWNMGAKISVDSATMMNKGLEIIEAYHLFPLEESQIDVVVHPESIVHGFVSYIDGSIIAGLSTTDMKVPIAHALKWPERIFTDTPRLNLADIGRLTFEKPDEDKFPALKLARNALQNGGACPTILNAANEVAVSSFIAGNIGFVGIVEIVEEVLLKLSHTKEPKTLEEITAVDNAARECAENIIRFC